MKLLNRRFLALLAVLVMVVAACGDDATTETTADGGTATTADGGTATTADGGTGTTVAGDEEFTVGVSWNNFNEERWAKADKPAIQAVVEAAGGTYIESDAGSSADTQLADVENLITQGADVLIILAQDGEAILPAVASALEQGIPVISYDRLIEDAGAFYLTFDNQAVGRIEAEVIFGLVPTGNYAIIKGNQADANADFLRAGMEEVIGDAVAAGDIVIPDGCEMYTDNWDGEIAQDNMENCLIAAGDDIDAALVENDGMATGVVQALSDAGLDIPVSGQDGDAAALNRVALGTQAVSVWKNAYALGQAAGELAVQLAGGVALADLVAPDDLGDSAPAAGLEALPFTSPGGNELSSIILTPIPITSDNLNIVIDSGWITVDQVCQGVTAGSVAVCP